MAEHLLTVVRDEFGDLESTSIICPGVTESCETWWECDTCLKASREQGDGWDDDLWETEEAHGVEHRYMDGWAVRGNPPRCIGEAMDDGGNFSDAADGLPSGDYPCTLDGTNEYVDVALIGVSG